MRRNQKTVTPITPSDGAPVTTSWADVEARQARVDAALEHAQKTTVSEIAQRARQDDEIRKARDPRLSQWQRKEEEQT
jgi:hypothetical protein